SVFFFFFFQAEDGIRDFHVTGVQTCALPICLKHNITLPSVKQVVMFGAPVRLELHKMFEQILPFGDTYTPYGATEFLPVAVISGHEIIHLHQEKMKNGYGVCLGKAVPEVEIRIAKTSDIPEG